MIRIQLNHDWTDENGVTHLAGEWVEVDQTTRAKLEALGWVGMTGDDVG